MSYRLIGIVGASAVIVGCASMDTAPLPVHMAAAEGSWLTPAGRRVDIRRGPGEEYTFTVTDQGGGAPGVYSGRFLKVLRDTVLEVEVAAPRAQGGEQVPVRIYGRTKIDGDSFSYEPLRRAWLEQEAARIGGLRVTAVPGDTRTAAAGTSVAVGDPSKIRTLLRDAVKDPGAFDAPTVLRRAK